MAGLGYTIMMGIIRLMGLKKIFKRVPMNYQKLRRSDVLLPKPWMIRNLPYRQFALENAVITEITSPEPQPGLVILLHGGAFVSGPAAHHWSTLAQMVKELGVTVWMCTYPKAPEYTVEQVTASVDAMYAEALEHHQAQAIALIGDSAGGNLATTLCQRLRARGQELPGKLVLVSPVMDATLENPDAAAIERKDVMLSKPGLVHANQMYAGDLPLSDPSISPIQGSFVGFPDTLFYMGEYDILYPDQQRAVAKMREAGVSVHAEVGEKLPHVWPCLPMLKEGNAARRQIIDFIRLR